jgi:hypothetical protein
VRIEGLDLAPCELRDRIVMLYTREVTGRRLRAA